MKEAILNEYDQKKIIYLEYEKKLRDLLFSLIRENGITIHGIESRVKDRNSLSKKIDSKEDKYTGLDKITDTLGLRVITYFEDDVDKIANIVKTQFHVDENNSCDKRNKNFDSFGYSSLHYIIKLTEPRASLPEYSRFNEINFEIQIRSILQHAWAEIEHDIGYKSAIEIPVDMRRKFSRIAGLLELADIEFIRIKEEIKKYTIEVKEQIKSQNLNLLIDNISLKEFLQEEKIVNEIEQHFMMITKAITVDYTDERYIAKRINQLSFFGIDTIEKLKESLESRKEMIKTLGEKWLSMHEKRWESITSGISIFYLCFVLACEKEDLQFVQEYFNFGKLSKNPELPKLLFDLYNQIV
ncbi:GTP pyrophosphokinase [Neobacillus sp. LXY-1]|uniref:GTP pyrophosphokinase n=1 Tax=Neobacillus sp. LXY-1 TaxID=3379133 RepID=UPI003EE3EC51